jgi:hypothetical protein
MKVWQIAAGRSGQDYHDLFYDYDVMIMGSSQRGNALDTDYSDGKGASIGNQTNNFARAPQPGDRVVMRLYRRIVGIGEIPTGDQNQYSFEKAFRTVFGWDLCHTRRVKWAPRGKLGPLAKISLTAFQQPTFTQVHQPKLIEAALAAPSRWFDRPLKRKPSFDASTYNEEELGEELFSEGISNKNIQDIYAALRQADNLISWYEEEGSGKRPSEHEVISHIILPLFLGLGWSHQQMAVEWKNIDIAFFKRTPTNEDNCVMVLEAKGLYNPLGSVLEQPIHYIKRYGLAKVKYILVTNGLILLVYARSGKRWSSDTPPIAFLDVSCLQKQYAIPKGTNPVRTLVMLQPSSLR